MCISCLFSPLRVSLRIISFSFVPPWNVFVYTIESSLKVYIWTPRTKDPFSVVGFLVVFVVLCLFCFVLIRIYLVFVQSICMNHSSTSIKARNPPVGCPSRAMGHQSGCCVWCGFGCCSHLLHSTVGRRCRRGLTTTDSPCFRPTQSTSQSPHTAWSTSSSVAPRTFPLHPPPSEVRPRCAIQWIMAHLVCVKMCCGAKWMRRPFNRTAKTVDNGLRR